MKLTKKDKIYLQKQADKFTQDKNFFKQSWESEKDNVENAIYGFINFLYNKSKHD